MPYQHHTMAKVNRFDVQLAIGIPDAVEAICAAQQDAIAELLPNTIRAVSELALSAQRLWVGYASGAPLPDGRTIRTQSSAYAESIQIKTELEGNTIRYVIFSSHESAHGIEYGVGAYDMKRMLQTSRHTHKNKNGKRYMVIPIQDRSLTLSGYSGNPPKAITTMPLKRRADVPLFERAGVLNMGSRLTVRDIADLGLDPHRGVGREMVGMAAKRGTVFRTMTEDSTGWVRPARDGYHVSQQVADWLEKSATALVEAALLEDTKRLKGY